jgi:hypothetical protein
MLSLGDPVESFITWPCLSEACLDLKTANLVYQMNTKGDNGALLNINM